MRGSLELSVSLDLVVQGIRRWQNSRSRRFDGRNPPASPISEKYKSMRSGNRLEFTFQQSWGMLFRMTFRGLILLLPLLLPLTFILFCRDFTVPAIAILLVVLLITIDIWIQLFVSCVVMAEPWTLIIDEKTILRSNYMLLRTKEWTLDTKGASVCAYDLELPDCLFCWDACSMQAFHFISLEQGGKRLLFPCTDVAEQQERIKEIKTFLVENK